VQRASTIGPQLLPEQLEQILMTLLAEGSG
jgi:hypothetical protein